MRWACVGTLGTAAGHGLRRALLCKRQLPAPPTSSQPARVVSAGRHGRLALLLQTLRAAPRAQDVITAPNGAQKRVMRAAGIAFQLNAYMQFLIAAERNAHPRTVLDGIAPTRLLKQVRRLRAARGAPPALGGAKAVRLPACTGVVLARQARPGSGALVGGGKLHKRPPAGGAHGQACSLRGLRQRPHMDPDTLVSKATLTLGALLRRCWTRCRWWRRR